MKKIRLMAIALLLAIELNAQVTQITQFSNEEYDFANSVIVNANEESFIRFNMETLTIDAIPGTPELPVKYVRLVIPSGEEIAIVQISVTEPVTRNLMNKIYPVQKPVPVGGDTEEFILPDETIYNSDIPYPAEPVQLVNHGYFNGNIHIATFAVYPVQYKPLSGELTEYSSVSFTIETTASETGTMQIFAPNAANKNFYNNILRQTVENPDDIVNSEVFNGSPASGLNYYEYVIITSNTLSSSFSDFIAWKKLKGYDIGVITWENIRANYPNGDLISGINDTAGSIRQYLKDAWQNGTMYCLIGGDMNTVPARYGCGRWDSWHDNDDAQDYFYKIPNDLYYSDFNGDWEVDGDEYTGEPPDYTLPYPPYTSYTGDNVDFYHEIFVGRLLCTNATEIQNWFAKIKLYENNPGNGDFSYLTKAFITQADQMQKHDWADYILNKATWITDNVVFEEEGGPYTTTTPNFPKGKDVIDEFNNHYGLSSFMGHGGACNVAVATKGCNISDPNSKYKVTSFDDGTGGCCWIPETGNGFDNMTNSNHPSIFYSISCETMPFDDFGTPAGDRNMAEVYTSISNGGGPAYLGNTRFGWNSSKYLFGKFIDQINAGNLNLGVAEAISKENNGNHYLALSHNLIGCPETPLWAGLPKNMYLSVDYTNNKIRILNETEQAIEGAKVSFKCNGTYYFATTDVNGYADASRDIVYENEIGASYPGYLPKYTYIVEQDEVWETLPLIRGNIIVKEGVSLTMAGNITIPKYTALIIEENANLIIEGNLTLNEYSEFIINNNVSIPEGSTLYLEDNARIVGVNIDDILNINGNINLSENVIIAANTNINSGVFFLEIIVTIILNNAGVLDDFIKQYEGGIYKEQ